MPPREIDHAAAKREAESLRDAPYVWGNIARAYLDSERRLDALIEAVDAYILHGAWDQVRAALAAAKENRG